MKNKKHNKEQSSDRVTRRSFLQKAVVTAVTTGVLTPGNNASAQTSKPLIAKNRMSKLAIGELSRRIEMTQRRLTTEGVPAFTDEFVLSDVVLDPSYQRRFSNFSGDISGRYIGALAMLPPTDYPREKLDALVRKLIGYQRSDGRFGNEKLAFTANEIGKEHMALLWGNGRLLIGLTEYNAERPSREVLHSAARLGDFILKVREQCSQPEVIKRLSGLGAYGFICFTQCIEGLVMLSEQTKDQRYLETATAIMPLLPPRGDQHSHGYISTLRGIMMLHEATKDKSQLAFVEDAFRELVAANDHTSTPAPDYTVFGGVPEYFGWGARKVAQTGNQPEQVASGSTSVVAHSGKEPRDEGCSEADLLRLSLQLWHATGRVEYLERAEHCLLNQFFHNQQITGDFGHHTYSRTGFKPTDNVARSWWCCTMHGLRAFRDVVDSLVTAKDDAVQVNLFLDGAWSDERLSLTMSRDAGNSTEGIIKLRNNFTITIERDSPREVELAIRQPGWASKMNVEISNRSVVGDTRNSYTVIKQRWKKGEQINVSFGYRERWQTRDGKVLSLNQIGSKPVEAALFYGPYLLGADENLDRVFFTEPWRENLILLSEKVVRTPATAAKAQSSVPASLSLPSVHQHFNYIHGGFPGKHLVTLRPVSEQSAYEQGTVAVWLRFKREGEAKS